MKLGLFVLGILFFQYGSTNCVRSCSISTSSGKVKGDCSAGSQFLSIRYAKPQRLTQSSIWRGSETIDGTKLPPYCPQSGETNIDEDCLYLNVYGPKHWWENSHKLPVMVWVHGGSFILGGSRDSDGSLLAERENLVVITVNYRLGVLGFLETQHAQTNFGVGDVLTALKWIKINSDSLRIDVNRVTLFGESSGGTLVRSLLGSDDSRGLFSRAIVQSDPMLYLANSLNASESISSYVYAHVNPETASLEEILAVQQGVYTDIASLSPEVNPTYPFGPNLGTFIPSDFITQVSAGKVANPVPVIMGYNKDELGQTIGSLFPTEIPYEYYYAALVQQVGTTLADKLVDYYDYADYRLRLVSLFTAYVFSCPIQRVARSYPYSYLYELSQGITYVEDEPLCTNDTTVCHEDDLKVVFGIKTPTPSQKKLIETVQDKWGLFAKGADPWKRHTQIVLGGSKESSNVCSLFA